MTDRVNQQSVERAARRLRTTVRYLQTRCRLGKVTGSVKRYRWEGQWLRVHWFIPADFEMPYGGRQ